ncbi:uncharacterized protein LOC131642689 isoform X2 [Vicia villosa]|uniref:uncharacterized protein LOC131642689 isoform X2 n=1 Tax=Vicia villosa TaxID=3911 RepID=UPI00273B0FE7|nr:uncharacterized protein LOC131642689 isoform X2 [Vicia villosa]
MASPFGWYGPLIDLCNASHHIAEFVQLLVFVHRCFPVQYKSSKSGKDLTRMDIQVGDDTTPFFGVSLWQSQMGSMVSAGDVVLLQNFMITKFGGVVEAKTVQWSSLFCLVHPFHSLISKDVEEMIAGCRIGTTATKEKLSRVIKWVRQSRTTVCDVKLQFNQKIEYLPRNWTVLEEREAKDCCSLMEVSQLTTSCKTIVLASICEIVPLRNAKTSGDTVNEKIFLSRRVCKAQNNNLVEDLLCTGCQLCGSPLGSESEQNDFPLVCSKSSSRLHVVCSIYRPFMLYVWDESYFMPVLVKNKAAEILFGNMKAENVYSSYREQKLNQNGLKNISKEKDADERLSNNPRLSREGLPSARSLEESKSLQSEEKHLRIKPFNFYHVWLIFLKLFLKQGKNSPLKFEILVDPNIDVENGKFEMVSATLPCFSTK